MTDFERRDAWLSEWLRRCGWAPDDLSMVLRLAQDAAAAELEHARSVAVRALGRRAGELDAEVAQRQGGSERVAVNRYCARELRSLALRLEEVGGVYGPP